MFKIDLDDKDKIDILTVFKQIANCAEKFVNNLDEKEIVITIRAKEKQNGHP